MIAYDDKNNERTINAILFCTILMNKCIINETIPCVTLSFYTIYDLIAIDKTK